MEQVKGDMMSKKRFYVDGTRIAGYWAIYDRLDEDDTIWIDCKEAYLDCIVTALNIMKGGLK
ncbi:unnamed protein product [marine sediment metagenome]|uniref:Uncharacterized protein n=1 Tax=marine sediment metagenome TaxID=412755 RepID=X0ZW04_9ZZZZ